MHETVPVAEMGKIEDLIREWRERVIRNGCDPGRVHMCHLDALKAVVPEGREVRRRVSQEAVIRVSAALPYSRRTWPLLELIERWFREPAPLRRTPEEVRTLFYAAIRT